MRKYTTGACVSASVHIHISNCMQTVKQACMQACKRMYAPCPNNFQMQRIGLCTWRLQCRSLEASRQTVRRGDLHHVCMCVSTSDLYSSVIILLDSMCNPASIKLAANRARFAVVQSLSAKMAARIPSNADCRRRPQAQTPTDRLKRPFNRRPTAVR